MNKKLAILLALLMVFTFTFAACGGSSSDEGAEGEPAAVTDLSMATGGTSGTYYGFCGVVAQVLNDKLSDVMNISVESTGASKANIQLIDAAECQIAIVQNDVMYYAYTGTDMFDGEEPVESFSAVASCYPENIQIIANKSITSIDDLKGKNVSVGDAGSGCEFNARQILAAYGITFEDINVSYQSFADSADSLKNGTIDAAFVVAGYPTTAVTELSSTYDFTLVPLDADHIAALQADYGFYTEATVPADTYSCVSVDTLGVAVTATIIARNDVSEDVIYAFVKGIFDNQDAIIAGHTKGSELSLETAVAGIEIPFHAGAQKYFEEAGAL